MFDLEEFAEFVNKINESNSRNYKLEVLREYADNESVKYGLQYVFDPFIITGISAKKFEKVLQFVSNDFGNLGFSGIHNCYELFEYIKKHNTGRIIDLKMVASVYVNIGEEYRDLYRAMLTKNLNIGIDAKSINKVIGGLISVFSVQLANKYFDKPEVIKNKSFSLTTKIDGGRIIAIKQNGLVSFFTRQGQPYEGLVDLEKEMQELIPDNICFDGELTLLNPGKLTSKEQYKATMKESRKDGAKHFLKMIVFDCMYADEFAEQKCERVYTARREMLDRIFGGIKSTYFHKLPILYSGTDESKITEWLDYNVDHGEEGVMININDAKYDFKRTNALLKVKKFSDLDLEIIGFEEGINKLAGKLGAVLVRYKDNNVVKVGSGFTDEQREQIWNNKDEWLGKIITVKYFEETTNADGGISLRFPIFVDIRTDKTIADF